MRLCETHFSFGLEDYFRIFVFPDLKTAKAMWRAFLSSNKTLKVWASYYVIPQSFQHVFI